MIPKSMDHALKSGPVVDGAKAHATAAPSAPPPPIPESKPAPVLSRNWMLQIRCKFGPGEIKQHAQPLVGGVMVPCEAIEILRDATGLRDALFGFDVSVPATIEFVDSINIPVGGG